MLPDELNTHPDSVSIRVGNDAVLFDAKLDSPEYREELIAQLDEMLTDYHAVRSDDLWPTAARTFTAVALVPITDARGRYQAAKVEIVEGQVKSITRFQKHQPEMLHFAIEKVAMALFLEAEELVEPRKVSDEPVLLVAEESAPVPAKTRDRVVRV